jgi:alkylation response protein AidB-like acyl-CoA dehydrogenase
MAKLKASRVAAWAASEAVQIHGGVGYMLETKALPAAVPYPSRGRAWPP